MLLLVSDGWSALTALVESICEEPTVPTGLEFGGVKR